MAKQIFLRYIFFSVSFLDFSHYHLYNDKKDTNYVQNNCMISGHARTEFAFQTKEVIF